MKRLKQQSYYPIFMNLSGKKCVVLGGGLVATRKIKTLLECGAAVIVISPDICSELYRLLDCGCVQVISRRYTAGDLKGASIVISATGNSEVNREVIKEARGNAVLLNVVDNAHESDFILPASILKNDITIAISTGGKSPALARKIKTVLQKELDNEEVSLLDLISEVRQEIKSSHLNFSGEVWQQALNINLLKELLKAGKRETAKAVLLENLKYSTTNQG